MADYDGHIRRGHPIMMGLLCFFAIIEACITSWLVSRYNDHNSYPSNSYRDRLKFLCFVSWWTVVFTGAYLAVFIINAASFLASIASHFIFFFITWVFWLAGVASFTSALGGGRRCSAHPITYCHQLLAAEAFGWIEWIILTIAFIFLILIGFSSMRRGDRVSGGLIA
ncbi:hypothetical protein M231_01159 [Tremella mesenterica]|uniref:MARVEL domain-containing protein n=1 Tax=Tremella mesenterica TaxID=5217 RepID=A0A4Q1BU85_TREME|nr:hypothetical protein M231_01159 [Tremella mesenterica]